MARILFGVMLSIILELWLITECAPSPGLIKNVADTNKFLVGNSRIGNEYRHGSSDNDSSTNKGNASSDDNAPRHRDNCWNNVCYYSVIFGKYSAERRLWHKRWDLPKNQSIPIEGELEYRGQNGTEIKYISVENEKKSKDIYDDDIHIKEGGIGKNFVIIKIKTNNPPSYYILEVYGKR